MNQHYLQEQMYYRLATECCVRIDSNRSFHRQESFLLLHPHFLTSRMPDLQVIQSLRFQYWHYRMIIQHG